MRPNPNETLRLIECPACQSPKAVIVAIHYDEQMCFCPACQHVWDCPNPTE